MITTKELIKKLEKKNALWFVWAIIWRWFVMFFCLLFGICIISRSITSSNFINNMSEQQEKEFVSGFYPKPKHEKAPDFILSVGSFNVKQMLEFLTAKKEAGEEWVNYQVKSSKSDEKKLYAEVDNWKPENAGNGQNGANTGTPQGDSDDSINPDLIPF